MGPISIYANETQQRRATKLPEKIGYGIIAKYESSMGDCKIAINSKRKIKKNNYGLIRSCWLQDLMIQK